MAWWTTGAVLESTLLPRAVGVILYNAIPLRCSQTRAWCLLSLLCVSLFRHFLSVTYKSGGTEDHRSPLDDCNWMRPLTGSIASWGVCGGKSGDACVECISVVRVCLCAPRLSPKACVNASAFQFASVCLHRRAHVTDKAFTSLWELIAQSEHEGNPWWSRPLWIKVYSCLSEYLSGRPCKSGAVV